MFEKEQPTMVSPIPSSESSFVVRIDVEEHAPTPSEVQDKQGVGAFDMGDGDFELWVNGALFKTHAYLLKRFIGLKLSVEAALGNEGPTNKPSRKIQIQHDEKGVDDFQNMFKVLYASVVDGPFELDPPTLVSALRIATAYDHPNLRAFAIKHLESISLSAIERIRLARDPSLPPWESPAYIELCERDEAITKEEANILGIDAFVHVAKIREVEQRRRGRVVDAAEPAQEDLSPVQMDMEPSGTDKRTPRGKAAKRKTRKSGSSPERATPEETPKDPSSEAVTPEVEDLNPSFIGISTPAAIHVGYPRYDQYSYEQHFVIPGCECKSTVPGSSNISCPCRISPCMYEAIKALQTQQAAHITNMRNLEETIQEIEDRNTPVPDTVSTPCPVIAPIAEQVTKWLSGACT